MGVPQNVDDDVFNSGSLLSKIVLVVGREREGPSSAVSAATCSIRDHIACTTCSLC